MYNTASIGLDFVANIAEASDVLAPLKAVCRATKLLLDVIRVSSLVKLAALDLNDITDCR